MSGARRSPCSAAIARVVAVVILGVAACSAGDEDLAERDLGDAVPTSTPPATDPVRTSAPEFRGDADSPFCAALVVGAESPVLDPFQEGIDATDVEIRLRLLRNRFDDLAGLAPTVLAGDLRAVADGLRMLDERLDEVGHDLERAAAEGIDLSVVDDAGFVEIAARLSAYRTQVCGA